ncbi:MAG: SsrA-binding protein SmpB [Acidobacteria bacterium]|jgi:SsrA-binding protein|nr:SsrA-binding protein SmpB [Acidobacteriota bacterium]
MARLNEARKDLAQNRQAFHLYHILDRFEAGIALMGPEVKSVRSGQVQLRDAYAQVEGGEIWLLGCHVTPYVQHTHLTLTPLDPLRKRKLLMHKEEIEKLQGKVQEKGLTLVPLRVYLKEGKVKVEIALAKGKNVVDKRDALKEKDLDREARRALRER